MKVSIVIPVYRNPNNDEIISLRRCCEILGNYEAIIVAPINMDIKEYETIWYSYDISCRVERFDNQYFSSIKGYNRLLLSECFYQRFKEYDYILIYQPDAYVFEDKLLDWCRKGYDYIGAPLVGKFTEKVYNTSMPMRVGNGGFSLRRVQAYIDFFNGVNHVFTSRQIINRISMWKKPYTRIFVWLLMLLGWRNTPRIVANRWKYNEDDFWSGLLDNSNYALSKPTPHEALSFAFERFPSELCQITHHLPFGCHAWKKYQYDEFWKNHIR